MLYRILKNVIINKGWETKGEAHSYVDIFYSKKKITEEQYNELDEIVDTLYV